MNSSVAEIDLQLREEFRRHLGEYGVEWSATDPVLAVLFRTLAQRIGAITSDTNALRSALLSELLAGLNSERRFAQPAQTIVAYQCESELTEIAGGTELIGKPEHGGYSSFLTDYSIAVSPARIAAVFLYEPGWLQLLSGIALPDDTTAAEPRYEKVSAQLGSFPSVYIAIENLPAAHLAGHGVYLQVRPGARLLQAQLLRENWCFASTSGRFTERGLMRPAPQNGGQLRLEWLQPRGSGSGATARDEEIPTLPGGFWKGRCFTLPRLIDATEFSCSLPMGFEAPLRQIFGTFALFQRKRAWLRIQLDPCVESLSTALTAVHLHAQSASNVQVLHQTIRFADHGTTVPLNPEGRDTLYLVSALSIAGESGAAYVSEYEQAPPPGAGRYRLDQERITLTPGAMAGGRPEAYANLRLWMTEGPRGNGMGTARLDSFARTGWAPGLTVENITASAGGTSGEALHAARERFNQVLLSRDRLLTFTDLEVAVRSFDTRIMRVTVTPRAQRVARGGLRRAYHLQLHAQRDRFVDGDEEPRILLEELQRYLEARVPLDTELNLELAWA